MSTAARKIVKPTKGGSSLGATIVRERREVAAALVGAFAYGDIALIEHYIEGTEVAVSVVERDGKVQSVRVADVEMPEAWRRLRGWVEARASR